jgi:hypothetical protein
MPRFDGTGPRGSGPMTGRGEGYCVLELPQPGRPARGFAGLVDAPAPLESATSWAAWRPSSIPWYAFGRGRRGVACRRRGRRLARW